MSVGLYNFNLREEAFTLREEAFTSSDGCLDWRATLATQFEIPQMKHRDLRRVESKDVAIYQSRYQPHINVVWPP